MRARDWTFAGFGLTLAIVGGVGEVRHHIGLGLAAVVIGLMVWVICSGSRWIFDATYEVPAHDGFNARQNAFEPVANMGFDPIDPS
jgi:hypothetical protein